MNLITNETLKLVNQKRTASKRQSSITPYLKEDLYNQNNRLDEFFAQEEVRVLFLKNPKICDCEWEIKALAYYKDI